MTSAANDVTELTYWTTDAIHCGVTDASGRVTHYVIVIKDPGYALVQAQGEREWQEVALGDLDVGVAAGRDHCGGHRRRAPCEPRRGACGHLHRRSKDSLNHTTLRKTGATTCQANKQSPRHLSQTPKESP
jgi:hypothetical protein